MVIKVGDLVKLSTQYYVPEASPAIVTEIRESTKGGEIHVFMPAFPKVNLEWVPIRDVTKITEGEAVLLRLKAGK
ncbi:MAG TPA: hypothetical protein ENI27_00450 [bacterium]|nr:hypothetical protein [bacterium]